MKLGEDLKTWTGSARSCDWLYATKRMKWPSFQIIYRHKKSYSYETLWGRRRDHVEFDRI